MSEKQLPLKPKPIKLLESRGPNNPLEGSETWRESQILTDQRFTMPTPKTALPSIAPVEKESRVDPIIDSDQKSRGKSP
jgi:hypothetical protein